MSMSFTSQAEEELKDCDVVLNMTAPTPPPPSTPLSTLEEAAVETIHKTILKDINQQMNVHIALLREREKTVRLKEYINRLVEVLSNANVDLPDQPSQAPQMF